MERRLSTGSRPPSAWYAQPISCCVQVALTATHRAGCLHAGAFTRCCWLVVTGFPAVQYYVMEQNAPSTAQLVVVVRSPAPPPPLHASENRSVRQEGTGLTVDIPHPCRSLFTQTPGTSILQRQTRMCHVHINLTSRESLSMAQRASAGPTSMHLHRRSHLLPVHPPGRKGCVGSMLLPILRHPVVLISRLHSATT